MYMYRIWDAFPKKQFIYPCRIPRCICFLFSQGVACFFQVSTLMKWPKSKAAVVGLVT